MASCAHGYEVSIILTQEPRFNARPPLLSPKEQLAYNKWRREALTNKWIRPSKARHSCSMLWVPKSDGSLRACVNYVPLNPLIKSMVYAPPMGRALRSRIMTSTWYVKIDLKNAFHSLRIKPSDTWKTAFRTPHGVYEWLVLPFGLKNAPGEFQRYIEGVLERHIGEHVTVHIDDILIFSDTKRQCTALSHEVQEALRKANLPINEKKSVLDPTTTVDFTGYRFTNGSCKPLTKTEAIRDWPTPRNKRQLQEFLGTVNFMHDFVPRFAHYASPLFRATGKSWIWENQQDQGFRALKQACCNAIENRRYRPHMPSTLITDASLFAGGAILVQEGHVIAVWSRAYTPAERNYSADQRELLAVVDSLKAWFHDLEGSPGITIRTDNEINTSTLKPSSTNRRINRWILFLSQFQLTWQHIPGITNPADGISRRPDYK